MIRLHQVVIKVYSGRVEELGPDVVAMYPWGGHAMAYRVSSRRKPRGYVKSFFTTVAVRGGDGRYEASVDYRREQRWEPIGLYGQGVQSYCMPTDFPTKEAAVKALLSYQEFR
jgi:hypothetical protein